MSKKIVFLGFALCGALTATNAFAQRQYDVRATDRDLWFYGYALNDSGLISGRSTDPNENRLPTMASPFEAPPALVTRAAYAGTFFGSYSWLVDRRSNAQIYRSSNPIAGSAMTDISNSMVGIGYATDSTRYPYVYSAIWDRLGSLYMIADENGNGLVGEAKAVNDSSWVVGALTQGEQTQNPGQTTAFLWIPKLFNEDGNTSSKPPSLNMVTYLGVTGPGADLGPSAYGHVHQLTCTSADSAAAAVNNQGIIGGHCGGRPYLWMAGLASDLSAQLPARSFTLQTGPITRDQLLDLYTCSVTSIAHNSRSLAVYCQHKRLNNSMSFISAAGITSTLRQVDFVDTKARGYNLRINAINNSGTAVGAFWGSARNAAHTAIIASASSPGIAPIEAASLLSRLADPASFPWLLDDAVDINNAGQIVVTSTSTEQPNNQPFSSLLTPR